MANKRAEKIRKALERQAKQESMQRVLGSKYGDERKKHKKMHSMDTITMGSSMNNLLQLNKVETVSTKELPEGSDSSEMILDESGRPIDTKADSKEDGEPPKLNFMATIAQLITLKKASEEPAGRDNYEKKISYLYSKDKEEVEPTEE